MAEVKYVGLDELDVDVAVRAKVESDVAKHAEVIDRLLNNEVEIKIHVKAYSQSGKMHKYSVHIHVNYPGGSFLSDKAHDWDLPTAIKHGFKAVEHQIQHKFHS